jgi:signal transduction histidine kinase
MLARADGSALPVSVQAAPLRDASSGATEALLVVQDVTQLRQAEQLKDDFLSLISHEFRTPLTAIHGGAHMLAAAEDSLDAETRRELLGDVVAESDRLDQMLKNLLLLASVMAGRLPVETEPVLLGPLAREISNEVARRSPNHEFLTAISPSTPPVEGDPSLLSQVLRNLYENAVKYSPNSGQIRTTAFASHDRVAIAVSDQGLGIAQHHLANVFERFHRAGADPTVRGMGLGLYLSRLLVLAQGGTIEVSSPGPGEGSTFSVSLPIASGWSEDVAPNSPPLPSVHS